MDSSTPVKRVVFREKWCKACGICIAFCPRKALVADDGGKPIWNAELCVRCGLCEQRCPDFAIYVEASPERGAWGEVVALG